MIDMQKKKPRISDTVQQGAIAFAGSIATGAAAVAITDDAIKFLSVIVLAVVFGFLAAASRATELL